MIFLYGTIIELQLPVWVFFSPHNTQVQRGDSDLDSGRVNKKDETKSFVAIVMRRKWGCPRQGKQASGID